MWLRVRIKNRMKSNIAITMERRKRYVQKINDLSCQCERKNRF